MIFFFFFTNSWKSFAKILIKPEIFSSIIAKSRFLANGECLARALNGRRQARHVEFFVGLCFDGESYKFHCWFHMIYIIIMQFRGASFILLIGRDYCVVGMIMVTLVYMVSFLDPMPAGVGNLGKKNCHS